ncbi:putative NIPSNAP protein [Paraburkholderia sacchari]|uniref:NIPSNAP family protein n=1 Tax=Paraburkholderia sacchari TaxID=159450 RepID=UPI0039A6C4B0
MSEPNNPAPAPFYEVRLYRVAPGRLADMESRLLNELPWLFQKHGLLSIGAWSVLAGGNLPAIVYLLKWESMVDREKAWSGFYSDKEWLEVRARTNAGSELVERVSAWITTPNVALPKVNLPSATQALSDMHEMHVFQTAIGQAPAINDYLTNVFIPRLHAAGCVVVALLDIKMGEATPSVVLLLSWPNFAARLTGHEALSALNRQFSKGGALLGRHDTYVLRQLS